MKLFEFLLKICNSCYGLEHIVNQINPLISNDTVRRKKKFWNIAFDVLLGVTFCITFTHTTSIEHVTNFILVIRTMVKNYMEDILQWLMGVPAGLKLNHELSYCMGHFFLYHVYIWMSYLVYIEEVLNVIVTIVIYSSCCGLSCLLSLVNDSINLLTFHIYCFYVYAAKVYHLQLQALLSLARLFMGKKWNVLRLRVDSITYDADQLILGTILFTILLFLLPTTLLYYVVFATARLLVLIIQDGMYAAVFIITKFPVYDIFMQKFDKNLFQTGIKTVEFVYDSKDRNALPSDFSTSFKSITAYELIKNELSFTWPNVLEILKKISTGVVVKPWNKQEDG